MLLVLPSTITVFAQTILPQKLPFSAICAGGPHPTIPGAVFNEYQAQFKISGFPADETFVVQLSDAAGSFATPTATIAIANLPGTPPDTNTDKTLAFAVPTDLVGSDMYQLRIKSSSGVTSSSFTIFGSVSTKFFPAYFKAYNNSFYINDKNASISFCTGGSVILTVYNPTPEDVSSSPANYPLLTYKWYKDGNAISGQTGNTLKVTTEGMFYAEVNYGPCTDANFRSQDITVSSANGNGNAATIVSSLGNPFCSGSTFKTTLTATKGNTYIWKKDGAVIVGANSQNYETNVLGVYTCDIDFGGCNATATIDLKSGGAIYVDGGVVKNGEKIRIDQGDSVTVTATTTVNAPSYKWYLNDVAIVGATDSTLDITIAGNYKVNISGCDLPFIVTYDAIINYNVPNVSNIVSPNNDGINDTWIIPNEYNNTNTQVTILSSYGEIVYQTDNYDNYNGWPQSSIEFKNFNPVFYYIITPNGGAAKKGSITLLK